YYVTFLVSLSPGLFRSMALRLSISAFIQLHFTDLTSFVCPCSDCWTPWFDRDDPADTGDWETLFELRQEHPGKICQKPLQIQVQTTGGAPAASTGEVFFKFDTVTGFACRNQDQAPVCNCHDYRVRFMCPFHFCHRSEVTCWTQWFDRDDPAGSGDWETLINLHLQNPGKICTKPLQIQVKTTSGQSVSSTGNVIYNDTTTGFICRNSDQRKGLCSDYMVRFRSLCGKSLTTFCLKY
uniref:WxxW domain-containing protein n=1 Tax=Periophthalmus magnuspinnatus TaxID=409849 RepID=A0A3B4B6T8_9GOBI